jgi:hypothetical protein
MLIKKYMECKCFRALKYPENIMRIEANVKELDQVKITSLNNLLIPRAQSFLRN